MSPGVPPLGFEKELPSVQGLRKELRRGLEERLCVRVPGEIRRGPAWEVGLPSVRLNSLRRGPVREGIGLVRSVLLPGSGTLDLVVLSEHFAGGQTGWKKSVGSVASCVGGAVACQAAHVLHH